MFYKIAKSLIKGFVHIFFRLKVHNAENFPKDDAAIIVANHKSNWDPFVCASVVPRQLFFMAKKEIFDVPVLSGIAKAFGAFPVNREIADIGAIKTAMSLLKQGKCVAIFPEGTRVKGGKEHNVKSGAVMIASKAKVPVIPMAIKGKYGLFRKIDIYIGSPVYAENSDGTKLSHEEIDELSKQLMSDVLKTAGENFESLSC